MLLDIDQNQQFPIAVRQLGKRGLNQRPAVIVDDEVVCTHSIYANCELLQRPPDPFRGTMVITTPVDRYVHQPASERTMSSIRSGSTPGLYKNVLDQILDIWSPGGKAADRSTDILLVSRQQVV